MLRDSIAPSTEGALLKGHFLLELSICLLASSVTPEKALLVSGSLELTLFLDGKLQTLARGVPHTVPNSWEEKLGRQGFFSRQVTV